MPDRIETLWDRTRQGARNVAGVRFQTAVAAYMLATCGTKQAVTTEVVPEGLQDIDGRRPDGRRLHIQVKERAGGNTTLPFATAVAAIADAGTALRVDPEASFVIVTDARPGVGLTVTGWERPLADVIASTAKLDADVIELLDRCHLVCLDWDGINAATRTLLGDAHALPGAAADLLRARMLDDLLRVGGDQRDSDAERPIIRRRSDVDVLAARVRELVDLEALEQPVKDGLVEFVDFTTPLYTPVETFLTGVDVLPGHIAANLDVLRADELSELFAALATDRYVVIAGPSGSGKSALMWRGAHELGAGHRLVRLRRAEAGDVTAIVRWVRMLAPDETTPVLVCADNIGQPHTAAWRTLAAELLEQPGVRLLAASREEDFEPSFVTAAGVPLRPQLTPALGHEIAAQLEARDVPLRASADEALADAQGLLMEFVAILATGQRLEQVVTAQVHDRFAAERQTERAALRFVAAAHIAGLALDASVLGDLCDDAPDLQKALATLADEFLIRQPHKETWSGLHELRSSVVNRVLHQFPPPTESDTIDKLIARLDAPDATHLLRRTADRGDPIGPFVNTIGARVGQADAAEVAAWIRTAFAVDVLAHTRRCIDTAKRSWSPSGIGLVRFAWLRRFARFPDDMVPEGVPIQRYADSLPEPETEYGGRIAGALSGRRLAEIAAAAPSADAAALLEACATAAVPVLSTQQANAIARAHHAATLGPFSRIVAALWVLCPEGHAAANRTFGPRSGRLDRIAREDCGVLRWTAEIDDRDPTGLLVSLQVFVASGELDQERRRKLARVALDICPEAVRIEIDPRGPKGSASTADVWGGGRFHRSTAANPYIEGRRPRLMSESLDRLNAAQTWAQRLASQHALAQQLVDLAETALERLLATRRQRGPPEGVA